MLTAFFGRESGSTVAYKYSNLLSATLLSKSGSPGPDSHLLFLFFKSFLLMYRWRDVHG